MSLNKTVKNVFIVSIVLSCIGIVAWIYQIVVGMQVTGLDNSIIWGLSVGAFFAIIAAGAGLFALCGISEFFGFMTAEQRQLGIAFSFAAMAAGGILVIMDLGNPVQMLYLITSLRFGSFSVLDFWLLLLCMIVAVVYFFRLRSGKPTKVIGVIAIVLSAAIIIVEGLLLANNTSHPLWASSMNIVSFLLGAFLAGSALFAVIVPERKRVFLIALIASATITVVEVGTHLVAGTDITRMVMMQVVAGPFAPYFYFQIIVGLIVPIWLLVKTDKVAWASLCGILGLAAEKLWLLCAGETEVWGQSHHIGMALSGYNFVYVPSFVEIALTVGALSIGVALFLIIKEWFLKSSPAE